jgi:serine/threonine protein phosphatase PrpC
MIQQLQRLSAINQGAPNLDPDRVNEDTILYIGNGNLLYLIVIDGASQRLKASRIAALGKQKYGKNTTGASYAANLTRDTIAKAIVDQFGVEPDKLLLAANDTLRVEITKLYGAYSAEAILQQEPTLSELRDDPRLVRLALPVCVATIALIDFQSNNMRWAHAGDTALFLFHNGGRIEKITNDPMEQHDQSALKIAKQLQDLHQYKHFAEVIGLDEVTTANKNNGLYHNYVEQNGEANYELGVAVVNGLPELSHYIQKGNIDSLTEIQSILLCTDGFMWPAKWQESKADTDIRLQLMIDYIKDGSLSNYLERLRKEEEEDSERDNYPRFKVHDDAAALYLELNYE